MSYIIYKLTSPNNKVYIGQTRQTFNLRMSHHKSHARIFDRKINRAIRKYGWENFQKEIIYEAFNQQELNDKERYFIKFYDSKNNGYNSSDGGDRNSLGCKHSKESVQRMVEKRRLNGSFNPSESTRLLMSKHHVSGWKKGYRHSQESINKMSIAKLGNKYAQKEINING